MLLWHSPLTDTQLLYSVYTQGVKPDIEQRGIFFSLKYIGRGCLVWEVSPLFSDMGVIHQS